MRQISTFLFFYGLLTLFSCIEPYKISIGENEVNKYIVSGLITDEEGYQYVNVSIASQIDDPQYLPLDNCQINIIDNGGNEFLMEEYSIGEYRVWMNQENLLPGTSYHLEIVTPAGVEIKSEIEQMPVCPDIDSIYYLRESKATSDPNLYLNGIQFYADVDAKDSQSAYLKWEIQETWEYHASYPKERYYDGEFHQIYPPDNSKRICWMTENIESIFTLSLTNYSENIYRKFPLHFVDQTSSKLVYLYSFLIRQYSLNEDAYIFWEQMRSNSSADAGLYERQPISVKGNINSSSHPSKQILGFFSVSSVKTKRIFVEPIKDLVLDYDDHCLPSDLTRKGWLAYTEDDYPVYYIMDEILGLKILSISCVDCTVQGGTTIKPDFWPEK